MEEGVSTLTLSGWARVVEGSKGEGGFRKNEEILSDTNFRLARP